MYNPTLRLLTILELLQSRGEVSGQELAQTLEVEERSIRRYIMMLRDIGIPIEGERGRHGGYSLRPSFRLPPLMFNAEEITVVMMGLMLMRELGSASQLAIERATAKIERVLPVELRDTIDALRDAALFESIDLATYEISSDAIVAFTMAIHESKCLDIEYTSAQGEVTRRRIASYGLILHGRAWYLAAYCYLREDMRVFRADRIISVSRTEQTFTSPADFDAKAFVIQSIAQTKDVYRFEVLFHAPLTTVQATIPPSLGRLEAVGDETVMRCYSDDPDWLARYLVRIELAFTIRKTAALRAALRALAQDLLSVANEADNEDD